MPSGCDDRAELDFGVVGDRDHVPVELRVEDPDSAESVCDRVSDGTGHRQRCRAVQKDDPAAREFAGSVHLGETGDGVLDDLVILRGSAEGQLQDVGVAGDVVAAHGVLLCEIVAHDGRGDMP